MSITNVAIVDEHCLFLSALKSLINEFQNYKVLLDAKDLNDLYQKITKKCLPEIVVVGWREKYRRESTSVIQQLRSDFPKLNFIILSLGINEEIFSDLIKLEIKGYMSIDTKAEDFKTALETVANGGYYFPKNLTAHLIQNYSEIHINGSDNIKFSDRDIEFIKLCATELTYKEIANKLNVGVRTVDGYRDNLFEKLNVRSRVGLVLYAIRKKWLQLN
ncbi:MAG: response regulator transcription factor [Segetibacter sp.]|nr:response regulator transcription factor [Segetibacter sp.]